MCVLGIENLPSIKDASIPGQLSESGSAGVVSLLGILMGLEATHESICVVGT